MTPDMAVYGFKWRHQHWSATIFSIIYIYILYLMLSLADMSLYCRLHHAASKASVDSSAVSFRLMRCTADTVETSYYYTHDD